MTLTRIGHALYGDTWVSQLARATEINLRTVQRWAAADTDWADLPDGFKADVRALIASRIRQLNEVLSAV